MTVVRGRGGRSNEPTTRLCPAAVVVQNCTAAPALQQDKQGSLMLLQSIVSVVFLFYVVACSSLLSVLVVLVSALFLILLYVCVRREYFVFKTANKTYKSRLVVKHYKHGFSYVIYKSVYQLLSDADT